LQRYLRLLLDPTVEDPSQVIAITFTRKATEEIRSRILKALDRAAARENAKDDFERITLEAAALVLERDAAMGWHLLQQPERLNIRTIDSLASEIARALPLLSGGIGRLSPVDDAGSMYLEAARRVLGHMGSEDEDLDRSLRTVLLHRDANLPDVENLITGMLKNRDQWGTLIPLTGAELEDGFLDKEVLPRLNTALEEHLCNALTHLYRAFPPDVLERVAGLANRLCEEQGYNGSENFLIPCREHRVPPSTACEHLPYWMALIGLLVAKDDWRKSFLKHHLKIELEKKTQEELKLIVESIRSDALYAAMDEVRTAPRPPYPPEQWEVTKALLRLLRRALVELRLVFAQRSACDFTEISLAARSVLHSTEGVHDLAAAIGVRLQHLLMDEMQDTSTSQYDLLESLTAGWDGHSQTLFLVGDPKQSIYLFREARVELFLRALKNGMLGDIPLERLRLSTNFRSQASLVDDFNTTFRSIFPGTQLADEIVYTDAAAALPAEDFRLQWHARVTPSPDASASPAERARLPRQYAREEAEEIASLLHDWREASRGKHRTSAVLVRSRSHASILMEVLHEAAIPFHAMEMETLGQKPEVLDVLALTRALLHPADRIAWLAMLRAPWCGITLASLHSLAAGDDSSQGRRALQQVFLSRFEHLAGEERTRVERTLHVLQDALTWRGRLSLSHWVERTWRQLGGDLCMNASGRKNVHRYLRLLDKLTAESGSLNIVDLEKNLEKLYAEPAADADAVEILTIHKAKGLEWDLVVIPALERQANRDTTPLLDWMQLPLAEESDDSAPVLLAPIQASRKSGALLNDFIRRTRNARSEAEVKRLFYVATTRARKSLHLFARSAEGKDGIVAPRRGTLLHAAWPVAEVHFQPAPEAPVFRTKLFTLQPSAMRDHPENDLALAAVGTPAVPGHRIVRLPLSVDPSGRMLSTRRSSVVAVEREAIRRSFDRPEGSVLARSLGDTVHAFIEQIAHEIATHKEGDRQAFEKALDQLPLLEPRIRTYARSLGLSTHDADRTAVRTLQALTTTLESSTGQWILKAHPGAVTESALHARRFLEEDDMLHIRMDRTFMAGEKPLTPGNSTRWIIDFKTSDHSVDGRDFAPTERRKYDPQMQTYAYAMHSAGETSPIALALYYPLLDRLLWWFEDSVDTRTV
jgi:ATP-dependent exoDNAse (exonuclease V) beta subunit